MADEIVYRMKYVEMTRDGSFWICSIRKTRQLLGQISFHRSGEPVFQLKNDCALTLGALLDIARFIAALGHADRFATNMVKTLQRFESESHPHYYATRRDAGATQKGESETARR